MIRHCQTPRMSCDLERSSGVTPIRILGLCKGLFRLSKIDFVNGEIYKNYIPCLECKICKNFRIANTIQNISYVVIIIIMIAFIWTMGTPQGAIRRHMLSTEGVQAAIAAEIKESGDGGLRLWNKAVYMVNVNGVEEQWQLWAMSYTCYAKPIS